MNEKVCSGSLVPRGSRGGINNNACEMILFSFEKTLVAEDGELFLHPLVSCAKEEAG